MLGCLQAAWLDADSVTAVALVLVLLSGHGPPTSCSLPIVLIATCEMGTTWM